MRAVHAPKSLLLVDDTQCYCTLMERQFRLAKTGTAVFTLSDGQRAIEHLALCGTRHPTPELVLLDRTMPGGPDGYAVLRAVRALAHLTALPIVMVSGSNDPEHVSQAHDAGADGYLVKPPEQDAYPRLVSEVLHWWQVRQEQLSLRDGCAPVPIEQSIQPAGQVLSRPAMMLQVPAPSAVVPTPSQSPLGQIHQLLQTVFGYVASGSTLETNGLCIDRKLMELTRACREEGIEEMDATGPTLDPVLIRKRGRVIRRLMTLEWSDTELLRRFHKGKRTIVEQRRLWREEMRNGCALVARRLE